MTKTPRLWQSLSQSLEEHPLPCSGYTSPVRLTCLQISHLWFDLLPHFTDEEVEALRGKQLVQVAQRGAGLISWKQTISRDKQTLGPWSVESPVLFQEPRVGGAEAACRQDPCPMERCPQTPTRSPDKHWCQAAVGWSPGRGCWQEELSTNLSAIEHFQFWN